MKKVVSQSYVIDGITYDSIEDIPADIYDRYKDMIAAMAKDSDENGIPDILEDTEPAKTKVHIDKKSITKIVKTQKISFTNQADEKRTAKTSSFEHRGFLIILFLVLAIIAFKFFF